MKRIEQIYGNQRLYENRIKNIRDCPGQIFEDLCRHRMSDMFFSTVLGEHKVGIELEYENSPQRGLEEASQFWMRKLDGSLRQQGVEFVSKNMQMVYVEKAFLKLEKEMICFESCFTTGVRTSVHIHHDIRRRTMMELRSFFALYLLFEKSLFNLAGPERITSRFCVPVNFTFNTAIDKFTSFVGAFPKYSALGLYRTPDLGTVEFRAHEGSKDFSRIMHWIVLGYMLLYTARTNQSKMIRDWIKSYSSNSVSLSEIQTKVFSPLTFPLDSSWDEIAIPNALQMLSLKI